MTASGTHVEQVASNRRPERFPHVAARDRLVHERCAGAAAHVPQLLRLLLP